MHALREPGEAQIQKLVNVDHHRNMALVAVTGEGEAERLIGVARYAADNDTDCEFAVSVADDWQCRGIGTRLVPLLFEHAAREGFKTIYGAVLADNHRMIELAQWLGLTVDAPRAGEHTVRAWRNLQMPAGRAAMPGVAAFVDPAALSLLIAANATPVLVAWLFGKRLDAPIDALFRRHGHRPVFGAHKTWRGLVSGAAASLLLGALLPCGPWIGLGFGVLALIGDLASSFVKRRMNWKAGYAAPLLDQLPESLLPLIVFADQLGLNALSIAGTAALFTLLDAMTARWRRHSS
jgi:GNAT superfamily N-acetyltransferase